MSSSEETMDIRVGSQWTIGGDFKLVDVDDDDAPVVTVAFHDDPVRIAAIDPETRKHIAELIVNGMLTTPHPFESVLESTLEERERSRS